MASTPRTSVAETRASPIRVTTARRVCQGSSSGSSPSSSANRCPTAAWSASGARWTSRARVPAAPPACTGSRSATSATCRRASCTPVSHWAAFRPNVVGTACWVSVRPTMRVSRWVRARCARALPVAARSAATRARPSRATTIRAVSRTSWLVSPRWTPDAASSGRDRRSNATSGTTGLPAASHAAASSAGSGRSSSAARVTAAAAASLTRPVGTRARDHAASTRSIAASRASSSATPRARSEPGEIRPLILSSSVPRECQEHSLALSLEPDVEA